MSLFTVGHLRLWNMPTWRQVKFLASIEQAWTPVAGKRHLLDLVSPRVHPAAQACGPNHPPKPQPRHHITSEMQPLGTVPQPCTWHSTAAATDESIQHRAMPSDGAQPHMPEST